MDADERDICNYLRSWPGQYISAREISRRAGGKKRFREQPEWAGPVLSRLVEKGILETDSTAHYRLHKREREKAPKKWIAPQIKKILKESGKDFDKVINVEEDEEKYE